MKKLTFLATGNDIVKAEVYENFLEWVNSHEGNILAAWRSEGKTLVTDAEPYPINISIDNMALNNFIVVKRYSRLGAWRESCYSTMFFRVDADGYCGEYPTALSFEEVYLQVTDIG